MAFVTAGYRATVTLMDTAGDKTILTYDLNSATIVAANIDLAALIGSLGVLSNGTIVSYSMQEIYLNDAVVYPAAAEIENEAFFSGQIVGRPNRSGNFRIPAPVDAMFVGATGPNYNVVDMTYAPLITYMGYFDATGPVKVSDGEQLVVASIVGKRRKKGTSLG